MYGWRGRIGALMPANNTVLEPEMYGVLPSGVSLHGGRVMPRGADVRERVVAMTEALPRAVQELQGKVGVFCFACMTSSIIKPVGWHRALTDTTGGVPFLPAGETIVQALEHVGARRIGVFSPYFDEVASLVPGWFAQFGIQVVHNINVPFTGEQVVTRRLEEFYPLISREFKGRAIDALAILATDLATFTAINALEADVQVPVISSNLALLWSMLGALGVREATGPGALFRRPAAAPVLS